MTTMTTAHDSLTGQILRRLSRLTVWIVFGLAALIAVIAGYILDPRVTAAVLASAVRQSTPLVLGAMCGIIGKRAGVINIGIEC